MPDPVVVTGIGPVSAIGSGRQDFWESLLAGRHGFGPITQCDVSRSPCTIGAEVKDFNLADYLPRGRAIARRAPRPVQLALAAAQLAISDAAVDVEQFDPDRCGVLVGTSLGNVDEGLQLRDRWLAGGEAPDRAFYLYNHSAACVISSAFNLRGTIGTVSSGCNSALDALGQAMRLIQADVADAMLVVGTDCELLPEILALLNASGSLTCRFNDDPGRASRPFDLDRDGTVIGEGAGALWLESESACRSRGARGYARLVGHSVCAAGRGRAYNARKPAQDLRPCMRALTGAMREAGWQPSEVDVINANGSSSVQYDRLEAQALGRVFGSGLPAVRVHSIKSMLGQHGAGSSALQAIAACLTLREQMIPPTINHEHADPECGPLTVVTRAEPARAARVLVHSIGMGGFYYSCGAFAAADLAARTRNRSDIQ